MQIFEGIATSSGIAMGTLVKLVSKKDSQILRTVTDTEAEHNRIDLAIQTASDQLLELYEKARLDTGEEIASIFHIHATILEDEVFLDSIHSIIDTESCCAEYAVHTAAKQFASVFAEMADEYMQERAADVEDLSRRLITVLSGYETDPLQGITEPVILAAEELLPSQTIQLDKSLVLGFVSQRGSINSHASILARSLGIPSVTALQSGYDLIHSGDHLIIDGMNGILIHQPDRKTILEYDNKQKELQQEKERLRALLGTKAITRDGSSIEICANIGHSDESQQAIEMDADGIGLFRSEFLFLEGTDFPSEEVQFNAYKKVLETLSPKRVVIRTLDIGADKQAPYFPISNEDNPSLGYRAIRICLDRTDIFIPQLRALLRASVYGKLAIMFPMITAVEELDHIHTLLNSVKEELTAEGILYSDELELGIMVETPAAVMIADHLAKKVDFFSIGTNDLTQYTLACDRMNSKIAHIYDPGSLPVLRMIKHTADIAHQNGIWVGICGESAGNPELLPFYIALGIDELSVVPPSILKLKEKVQTLTKIDCIKEHEEKLN